MVFATIGTPSSYSTSAYLIPLSAKLHGFGESVSEDFYRTGRSENKIVKGFGDREDRVLLDCNLVTLIFDRGYFSWKDEYLREFQVILQNYFNSKKPYSQYLVQKEYSNCTEIEIYLLKNISLMLSQKPLEV